MKIGNKSIGKRYPVYVIAEIGINHNGDVNLAKKMIRRAKECGVNAVKFHNHHIKTFSNDLVRDKYF